MPWSPSVPESSTLSPGLQLEPERSSALGEHADAGGVDEAAVAVALLDHLGVAGDDVHARLGGRLTHGDEDPLEVRDREALFEDEADAQVERLGAAGRDVVDGAADGQPADVAAGEEERVHHVGVGGHRDARARERQRGGVVQALERLFREPLDKDLVDELLHHGAARTVGEEDSVCSHGRVRPSRSR